MSTSATPRGAPPASKLFAAPRWPAPSPSMTETSEVFRLPTATSRLPSLLKSPTATDEGAAPTAKGEPEEGERTGVLQEPSCESFETKALSPPGAFAWNAPGVVGYVVGAKAVPTTYALPAGSSATPRSWSRPAPPT